MKNKTEKTPTPEELEIERLRKELCNERIKVGALSRHCIHLGEALDAAILAEANKRRKAHARKMAEALEIACTRNAISLCISAVIGFAAIILGFVGFIHGVVAAIIAGGAALAFVWALNDCFYLLGRCEK